MPRLPPTARPFNSIPISSTPTAIMALLFTRQEQYGDALSQLNRALALDSENAQVYIQLGELYYRMDEYDKGLAAVPQGPEPQAGFGGGLLRRGDLPDQAGADPGGDPGSDVRPWCSSPACWRPSWTWARPTSTRATTTWPIQYYQQAAAAKPDDARILFNLGSAYLKKERLRSGRQGLSPGRQNGPEDRAMLITGWRTAFYMTRQV